MERGPQPGGRGHLGAGNRESQIGNRECLGVLARLREIGFRSDGIREIRVEKETA